MEAASAPSYAEHVLPLFRAEDRDAMEFAFDLWSYEDVSDHAEDILSRLADGSMPCDGAWAEPAVETFRAWIAGGKRP